MGLSSLLSIARSALITHQRALDTTGHNIANASTEGYSRQRLNLSPLTPLQTTIGQLGRGVTADSIDRMRNQVLDASYRRQNGELGSFSTLKDSLAQVEGIFGEPSDLGLGAGIDQLFSAFGDLANDPAGKTPRQLVRQAAETLSGRFRAADQRLGELAADTQTRMQGVLAEVNAIAREIADLNVQIRAGTSGDRGAPDVMDRRDVLVDRLSGFIGVRVVDRGDGTIGVLAGDAMLVDAAQSTPLELRSLGNGAYAVASANGSATLNLQGGELAALVDLSTNTIPGVRARLDQLAAGIVTEVNALHRAGRNLAGATGIDFFDPAGTSAQGLALSQAVALSTDNIAAGVSGGAGDNTVALALAALRTSGVASFGGDTIGVSYQRLVADIGVALRDASQRHEAQEVIVQHSDTLRQSISGVSVDEELTHMIAQQNAFAAAARLVSVADEMMQDVLGMVR